jgi:hypothetical protein
MSQHARLLMEHFVGRTDAYAVQQADGSYVAVRKPLTVALLDRHVQGEMTLGTYLVTPEGKARCGVYDFDEKSDTVRYALTWLKRWFEHWGIPLYLEPSGHKGYHGWVLLGEFVPSWMIIKVLKIALGQLEGSEGITCRVEVFPKQSVVQDLGNPIKLPWGIHRKTGKRTSLLGEDFALLPDWGAGLIKPLEEPARDKLARILDEYSEEQRPVTPPSGRTPVQKVALPCFTRMLEGVKEGFRHIASFRLAVMLYRQGMDQHLARATLVKWDLERNRPPLGERQLGYNVRDAYTGKYKLGCPDIEAAGYCSEECPIYRKRGGERDKRVEALPPDAVGVKRIVKLGTDPPKYEVEVDGSILMLRHEQLFNLREFQKLYHQKFDIIPNIGMKQREWLEYLNKLQSQIERDETLPDAADRSRYMDLLWQWLETTTPAQSEVDIEAGRPLESNGKYYFRARDAQEYLKARHHLNIERSELWALLRHYGGLKESQVKKVGKKTFRFWVLPVRGEAEESEAPVEEEINEDVEF